MRVVDVMPVKRWPNLYDWNSLCNGKAWELIPGKDFPCTIAGFRSLFAGECKRRGKKGKTTLHEGKLYVQAIDPNEKRKGGK